MEFSSKPKVLYIDDEERSLSTFKKSFRRDFEIFLANNIQEAVDILRNNAIEIILTDQRMPDMTGVEFLSHITKDYPHLKRILITGYADLSAVIDAINKGQVYRYINKPYQKEQLLSIINDAHKEYKLTENNKTDFENFKQMFSNSLDPNFITNEFWEITQMNGSFATFFNYSKDDLIKTSFFDLVSKEIKNQILPQISEKNVIKDLEITIDVNGASKSCILSIKKESLKENTPTYQGVIKDITQYRRRTEKLVKNLMHTHEDLREEISRQLHDSFAQKLAGVKFLMSALSTKEEFGDDKALKALKNSNEAIDNVIRELREICFKLIPLSITSEGLVEAIKEFAIRLKTDEGIVLKSTFSEEVRNSFNYRNKESQLIIFRFINDLISMLMAKVKLSEVCLDFSKNENNIVIHVSLDDGILNNLKETNINWKEMMLKSNFLGGSFLETEIGKFEISLPTHLKTAS